MSRIRVQLGAELRALRTIAGETQRGLAQRVSLNQVTVSRTERGEHLLTGSEINEWLDAYSAVDSVRQRISTLAEAAHSETRSWPDMMDEEAAHIQGVAQDRELDAARIRNCQTTFVPGLLQTAEYARQLIPQVDLTGTVDHAAAVARRLERQQILFAGGRRFEFLIAEQALLWSPATGVMDGQRDRLMSVATIEGVEVRVLPSRRVGSPLWHNFVMFDPADGAGTYVTTELLHGGQRVSKPDDVALFEQLWRGLWDAAVDVVEFLRGPVR